MTLTREEFNVLLMLYAASIDGNVRKDEVEEILNRTNPDIFKKVQKAFVKMSDMEILELIDEYKKQYITSEAEKTQVLDQLRDIMKVDDSVSPIENYLIQALGRVL